MGAKTSHVTATELIDARKTWDAPELASEVVAELRQLLAYNDTLSATDHRRVPRSEAIKMLFSMGVRYSPTQLDAWCRTIGRQSWVRA